MFSRGQPHIFLKQHPTRFGAMNRQMLKRLNTVMNYPKPNLRLFILLFAGLFMLNAGAQNVSGYAFNAGTAVYTPLTGATSTSLTNSADDEISAVFNIGFTFDFGGINYTQVMATSNGVLLFGTGRTGSATNNLATATSTQRPGIAALWDDLQCRNGVKYILSGIAPNRILTVEWANMEWNYQAPGPVISFQIKLHEGSNVIELNYRQESAAYNPGSTGGASIGIMGGTPTNFVSLLNAGVSPGISTTTPTNNIGTRPATNQRYTFIPPPPLNPHVVTGTVSGVTNSSAIAGGGILSTGHQVILSSGILISTSPMPTHATPGVIDSPTVPLKSLGSYSFNLSGLAPATTYYVRAYATGVAGTGFGGDSLFTTAATINPPTVSGASASGIGINSATVGGNITLNGGSPVTNSGVVLGTTPNPARGDPGVIDSATNPLVTSGSYYVNIASLTPNTRYYFRAYASNMAGTAYSTNDSFTTLPLNIPSVSLSVAVVPSAYFASLSGNITSNGNGTISASGVVYGINTNPAIGGPGVVDSANNPLISSGVYTKLIGGLAANTKYYYRAYAINQAGTAYSALDSFTTLIPVSAFPYTENFDAVSANGWLAAATGGGNNWERGTPAKTNFNAAYSGTKAWVTKLTGNYDNGHLAAVYSPPFDFTSLTTDPVLLFRHKFITENNWDAAVVEVSVSGGTWTKIDAVSGSGANFNTTTSLSWYNNTSTNGPVTPPKFSNNSTAYSTQSSGWIQSQTIITGAAGRSDVRIRFRFGSDGSGTDEGWIFDDVQIYQISVPVLTTASVSNITTITATTGGNIGYNGGSAITASGIVIGTSPSPVLGSALIDSATNPVVTAGSFTKNIAGLTAATTYYVRSYATNATGTGYGADSSFTTAAVASIPNVTVTSASSITASSVVMGGTITGNGGSPVITSGVVYSQSPFPVLGAPGVIDSTTNPLVTSGSFSIQAAGLSQGTTYYYRAYAINLVGIAYSAQDSFTTDIIVSALPYFQNFDSSAASGWSAAAINGGANNWVRGTPVKAAFNAAYSAPYAWVTKLSGTYDHAHHAALVSPQFDMTGISVDPVVRFRHKFITEAGWDAGIVEISIGGGAWTKLDGVVGTGSNFNTTTSTAWYNNTVGSGPIGAPKFSGNSNTYSSQTSGWLLSQTVLTGAAGQSNIRFRFRFGSDASGADEGWMIDDIEVIQVTAPFVQTGSVTNIAINTVTVSGSISSNGGAAITASGIIVSTTPAATRGTALMDSSNNPVISSGTFQLNIGGLTGATTYYIRAYAVNAVGTSYGPDSSFTTNVFAVVPTLGISAVDVNHITDSSATVSGSIISNGGGTITASGIVYGINPNPALGVGAVDSTTTPLVLSGAFGFNLKGLSSGTTYYLRSYATNAAGTGYSSQDSFITDPIVSVFPYVQTFDVNTNTGWKSASTGGVNGWVVGTPAKVHFNSAYSGTKAWVTKLSGNYDDLHDGGVISPRFNFSALTDDPILRFRHKFLTENNWDAGSVEISINGGAWAKLDASTGTGSNFNTAASYTWYNNNSANGPIFPPKYSNSSDNYSSVSAGWLTTQTRLTGAAGQANVRIRFRFGSDASGSNEGWIFDNIEVFTVSTPTIQASGIFTSNIGNDTLTLNWTSGNGSSRLVVARTSSTVSSAPSNWKMYTAASSFASGDTTMSGGNFVVYKGNGNQVKISGLSVGVSYAFDVYEMNGELMHVKYIIPGATGTATTTPVRLMYFHASEFNGDVLLNWSTASETNNAGFVIERSADGIRFEKIAFVEGNGNSNNRENYLFTDKDAFKQSRTLYYRLKQLDADGAFTYSPVIKVMLNNLLNTAISVKPNPFNQQLTVALSIPADGLVQFSITDMTGKIVWSNRFLAKAGNSFISLEHIEMLKSGPYLMSVTTSETTKVIKIIKE